MCRRVCVCWFLCFSIMSTPLTDLGMVKLAATGIAIKTVKNVWTLPWRIFFFSLCFLAVWWTYDSSFPVLITLCLNFSCCLLSSEVTVSQLCLILCDPKDCIVSGILQAKILQWVAFPFSRGSSQPRDWTQVSRIAGRFFTSWATREAPEYWRG